MTREELAGFISRLIIKGADQYEVGFLSVYGLAIADIEEFGIEKAKEKFDKEVKKLKQKYFTGKYPWGKEGYEEFMQNEKGE